MGVTQTEDFIFINASVFEFLDNKSNGFFGYDQTLYQISFVKCIVPPQYEMWKIDDECDILYKNGNESNWEVIKYETFMKDFTNVVFDATKPTNIYSQHFGHKYFKFNEDGLLESVSESVINDYRSL